MPFVTLLFALRIEIESVGFKSRLLCEFWAGLPFVFARLLILLQIEVQLLSFARVLGGFRLLLLLG